MKKISTILAVSALVVGLLSSCKKSTSSGNETVHLSTPPYQVGQVIQPGNVAAGNYQGTMTSGNVYKINGAFVIPRHDTVLIQPGVNVCMQPGSIIIVQGVLISLGTQANPNYIEACDVTPIDQIGNNPATDPAWNGGNGQWYGIACDTSCTLLDIQWTHISYVGGTTAVTYPFNNGASGYTGWPIYFQNPNGDCILTDSWIYGCNDDATRFAGGRIYFARNTLEKSGYTGGDGFNAKNGTQGDMAFNLCIGNATNSTKCSNKGSGGPECNINMYNNTYIDCGYRQAQYIPRGSDIDFEQQGRGTCYNNLIVNCRTGIRIGNGENAIPWPDTSNLFYSNNYIYADSTHEVAQFFDYAAGSGLKGIAYVIPTAAQLNLPADFYDPTSNPGGDILRLPGNDSIALAGAGNGGINNPMFKNFPLPEHVAGHDLSAIASVATGNADVGSPYDFHLQTGSPAIGKGTTNFSAFVNISHKVTSDPVYSNAHFGFIVSQPSADLGCYPTNGSGNQH